MVPEYYGWGIDRFFEKANDFQRPLFIIAHQDDEVGYAGLIQRLGKKTQFIWVTNGDGLYFTGDYTPRQYAEIRMAEAINAVGALGIPETNTQCLEFSEVEIYRHMSYLQKDPGSIGKYRDFWNQLREGVRDAIFQLRPDAVFTCAWQGGQPEHDLTHYFARLAIDELEAETQSEIPFYHLPEYEYTILVAFRFHPLYKGRKLKFKITPEELEGKKRVMEAYPSQIELFEKFQKVLSTLNFFSRIIGGPTTVEEYISTEHFGPVPPELNYAKGTHIFDMANYIFDDFEGTPITFRKCIRPVLETFPRRKA